MMFRALLTLAVATVMMAGPARDETRDELVAQVRAAETAFAKTMATRDSVAFASFLADEALFLGPPAAP